VVQIPCLVDGRHSVRLPTTRALAMSSNDPLRRLFRLDRSSSKFHDQVSNILYGEEYRQWVPNLPSEDLVGLVDYLDKVLHRASPLRSPPRSSKNRRSMLSILPVPLSGSVCASSERFVAPERYYHHRTRLNLPFWTSVVIRSPREVLAMCTKGPSTVLKFASNVFGSTPGMVQRRPQKCVTLSISPFATADENSRPSTKRRWCGNG